MALSSAALFTSKDDIVVNLLYNLAATYNLVKDIAASYSLPAMTIPQVKQLK